MERMGDKFIFGMVKIGEKGQIVIPKQAREVFGLKAGDQLLMLGDLHQGIALVKPNPEQIFDAVMNQNGCTED